MLAALSSVEVRSALTAAAVVVGVVAVVPYLRAMRAGVTKPHPMTWAVWAALTGVGFAAQVSGGGGVAAVVLGFSALVCAGVAVYALRYRGEVTHRSDWYAFVGVVVALTGWALTSSPLTAVVLITVVDAAAFAPTVRKTWVAPHTETLSNFTLSSVKLLLGVAALEVWSLTTVLYPMSLIVMNLMFAAVVMWRRRRLARRHVAFATPVAVPL